VRTIFRAKINLFPKTDLAPNAREKPTSPGYRPHIIIEDMNDMLAVSFLECMDFGENDVIFKPLYKHVDYSAVQAGVKFKVREGPFTVACGQILERID
jgi:hypothetical protein